MQRFAFWTFVAFLIFTLAMPACKHDPVIVEDPDPVDTTDNPIDTVDNPIDTMDNPVDTMGILCDPDTVYFQNQILPLLVSHCSKAGCHNEIDHQKDIVLTTYDNVVNTVEGVKNQDWSENKLMKVLALNDPDKRMPPAPNQKLTFDQVQLIAKWIAQGAQNNRCNEDALGCDTTNVKYSSFVAPLVQAKCSGCHSGSTPPAGVKLTDYSGVKTIALNGKMHSVITRTSNWMPRNGTKLDDCSVQKIQKWIAAGAPEN